MNYMASELEKQITTLEELSAVQQRFVSDVSHELRTPLTTVRMAAEVLHEAREDFDPVSARSAELMQTELDRFEALLTDLLEISRFDAGAAVLTVEEVDLRDRRVSGGRGNVSRLAETLSRPRSPCMPAERPRRRWTPGGSSASCATCLVNAIEHSEGNPIDILIESDDAAVAVAVRDHGVGFEASRPSRSSTASGGATRRGPARSAAPGSAWRSPWRTPTCTAAG